MVIVPNNVPELCRRPKRKSERDERNLQPQHGKRAVPGDPSRVSDPKNMLGRQISRRDKPWFTSAASSREAEG